MWRVRSAYSCRTSVVSAITGASVTRSVTAATRASSSPDSSRTGTGSPPHPLGGERVFLCAKNFRSGRQAEPGCQHRPGVLQVILPVAPGVRAGRREVEGGGNAQLPQLRLQIVRAV